MTEFPILQTVLSKGLSFFNLITPFQWVGSVDEWIKVLRGRFGFLLQLCVDIIDGNRGKFEEGRDLCKAVGECLVPYVWAPNTTPYL